jgi:hypothetical protein
VSIAVPLLYGTTYYLTVGFGEGETPFEKEGVPYIRPQYRYAIMSSEELKEADVMPITKFTVNNGDISVDSSYIPPCLLLSANSAYESYHQRLTDLLRTLSEHAHLREGDGKRSLMRYFFLMKSCDLQGRVSEYVRMLHEIAQAVDYFIMAPYAELPAEILRPDQVDIAQWLDWLLTYLTGANTVLDGLVLEDDTIDYEALLAQAKAELYEKLHPELIEKLLADMKAELQEEMRQQTEQLTTYINETLKTAIINELTTEFNDRADKLTEMLTDKFDEMGRQLNESLYEKLYFNLFENLFNALYVPEPEELKFVPQI